MPCRNWRDAFEDLLALETRGSMIETEVRMLETKTALEIHKQQSAERIRKMNELDQRWVSDVQLAESIVVSGKEHQNPLVTEPAEKYLKRLHDIAQRRSEYRKLLEGLLTGPRDPAPILKLNLSSSYFKTRGHWMASLSTSGACPNWYSNLTNSADGEWWQFGRDEMEPWGLGDIAATEQQLFDLFENGKSFEPNSPSPSPYDYDTANASPDEHKAAMDFNPARESLGEIGCHHQRWIPRPKATILAQAIWRSTDQDKADDQTMSLWVRNTFTNGKIDTRAVTDGPSAILEEVTKALGDISDRNNGLDQESYEDDRYLRDHRAAMSRLLEDDSPDLEVEFVKD